MNCPASGEVRTRFAPSPTGELHLGNVHTALFAWLFARRHGGRFVVRFEDTDLERQVPGAEQAILADLRWLGLDWDEGPDGGGPFGPYRQSERAAFYARAAEQLLTEGRAYECFCTPEELTERRASALEAGEPPHYDGRCRHLSPAEASRRRASLAAAGRRPVLRFRLPEGDRELVVEDLIHGPTVFHTRDLDDFVLVRPNGTPLYNFAVVVDDAAMAITHVLRGEEHLPNTPRQLLLFEALGMAVPAFAHLPMLLGPGRRKLSKREQAVSLRQYREEGYLPEALLNYLTLLGWSDPEGRELLTAADLRAGFSLERVSRAGAVFDPEQLTWLNREHLRRLAPGELWARLRPFLERATDPVRGEEADRLRTAVEALRLETTTLAGLAGLLAPFRDPAPEAEPEAARLLEGEAVPAILAATGTALGLLPPEGWQPERLAEALHRLPEALGLAAGKVFRPLRAALTGRASGPELPVTLALLGRDLSLARLDRVLSGGYNQAKGKDRAE
jgi:glutamyl-tRNA synthetase